MAMRAVLDTNAVIYLQKGLIAEPFPVGIYFISVITEMELLSFHGLDIRQMDWLNRFIEDMEVIGITDNVKYLAISIRRQYRLKLPDAIVAATAISCDAILFSNDQALSLVPRLNRQSLKLTEQHDKSEEP